VDLALRRSNVDGNSYSHEFDREEMAEVMDEERSQTSSFEEQWKTRVIETQPRRIHPDPFQIPNGSLRERTLPSARVQELVEPSQSRNGSLRECSPPGMRVQEIAEPSQTMDELRQLAVELNRRLGLIGHGGGPANGFYPAQPTEQGMPSVVRPNSDPFSMAQRSGPTDERFFQRPVDEGTPSVVRRVHDPNVHFQIS